MGQTVLHRFERGIQHCRRRCKIRVSSLQANYRVSRGFQRMDAICHRNRMGLANHFKLDLTVHQEFLRQLEIVQWINSISHPPERVRLEK